MPTRVSIIEDDFDYRSGLATILRGTPGFDVVGDYGSGEEALAEMSLERVDLVLVDISLGKGMMDGVECVQRLHDKRPGLLICVITVHEEPDTIFRSLCAGAKGYLLKKTLPGKLVDGLVELIEGGSPMSPSIARRVTRYFHEDKPTKRDRDGANDLTDRQREVLELLARGRSNKQVADQLGIALSTVKKHAQEIYEKLGVGGRTEAAVHFLDRTTPR